MLSCRNPNQEGAHRHGRSWAIQAHCWSWCPNQKECLYSLGEHLREVPVQSGNHRWPSRCWLPRYWWRCSVNLPWVHEEAPRLVPSHRCQQAWSDCREVRGFVHCQPQELEAILESRKHCRWPREITQPYERCFEGHWMPLQKRWRHSEPQLRQLAQHQRPRQRRRSSGFGHVPEDRPDAAVYGMKIL